MVTSSRGSDGVTKSNKFKGHFEEPRFASRSYVCSQRKRGVGAFGRNNWKDEVKCGNVGDCDGIPFGGERLRVWFCICCV